MVNKFLRNEIIFFSFAFLLDIIFKVVFNLFFSVTKNTGVAFSLFKDYPSFVLILNIVVFLVILFIWFKEKIVYLGFCLGGALGNLSERIIFGSVTDFIRIWRFPIFNVADIFITIGIILAIYYEIKKK